MWEIMKSGQLKSYAQAKSVFINSVLRDESGAAIADSEFTKAELQYFPQIGDTPKNIADKKRAREVALATMMAQAGPAWGEVKGKLDLLRGIKPKKQSKRAVKKQKTLRSKYNY